METIKAIVCIIVASMYICHQTFVMMEFSLSRYETKKQFLKDVLIPFNFWIRITIEEYKYLK